MNTFEFSIIVVTCNQLSHTVLCVESLSRTIPDTAEIVFVDNASSDGTCSYLKETAKRFPGRVQLEFLKENQGWCVGVNRGLQKAKGKYLVMLNNDVVLAPGWLEGLRECMDLSPALIPGVKKVGMAGPVTNSAGGHQAVPVGGAYDLPSLDGFALMYRKQHAQEWSASFFLSGFCLMISRDCYQEVGGLDEIFSPGGFDDNDLTLRVQEKGWFCVIAGDVFVHHSGSATFRSVYPGNRNGLINRSLFYEKWRRRQAGPKRLAAIYRVKNCSDTLPLSLEATAGFSDDIIILDDGSSDGTGDLCRNHPAVTHYEYQDLPFDERRDRNRLLELAAQCHPDWVISIDGDEVFEMDRSRAQRLMHLNDPHIKVLGFHWYTFWEPSRTFFRYDGIFGRMSGYRMYKWHPGQVITAGTPEGLHCGNIPQFPEGSHRHTNIRVRHLGYDYEEKRLAKYHFYRKVDSTPRADLVGNTNYAHLISPTVTLRKYAPDHGISLCLITKNEEERLEFFLSLLQPFVNEICIADTGSTDRTVEIARLFTDRISLIESPKLDLAQARNCSLSLAGNPWILCLDPDEEINPSDFTKLQRLTDDLEAHAYLFQVVNHQKDSPPVMTMAVRLFRNDKRIYYSRPVHETVEESLHKFPDASIKSADIQIHHYGYLREDSEVEKKLEVYFNCLQEYRTAHPQDPLPWYSEALHYLNEGKEDQAVSFLNKALEIDSGFLSPHAQLAYIFQDRAITMWSKLMKLAPEEHPVRQQAQLALDHLKAATPRRPLVGEARKRQINRAGEKE